MLPISFFNAEDILQEVLECHPDKEVTLDDVLAYQEARGTIEEASSLIEVQAYFCDWYETQRT